MLDRTLLRIFYSRSWENSLVGVGIVLGLDIRTGPEQVTMTECRVVQPLNIWVFYTCPRNHDVLHVKNFLIPRAFFTGQWAGTELVIIAEGVKLVKLDHVFVSENLCL